MGEWRRLTRCCWMLGSQGKKNHSLQPKQPTRGKGRKIYKIILKNLSAKLKMKSSIKMPFILLIVICFITIQPAKIFAQNSCAEIDRAFTEPDAEKPMCQCLVNPTSLSKLPTSNLKEDEENGFWIGCTRQKMPALFRSLFSMNDTKIVHFHIWDSLIPIIPNEMFSKIRPEKLTIETSRVGVLRNEAFANIGESLKELSLKNNILKDFEDKILSNLTELTLLDLSGNKLAEIKPVQIGQLRKLETLMLNGNQLSSLKDGLFQNFANLRMLNLANNRLKRITNETFKGLDQLEVLILRENRIESIDQDAFSHLKSLKILDLWHNKINKVEVRGLPKLERIILSNNSLTALVDVKLDGLPSLTNLHLEDNKISQIADDDLAGLKSSSKLISLTADGNNISWIGCRAFEPVPNLLVLSLQRNKITSLSCSSTRDPKSFFVYLDRSVLEPLKSLRRLLLSHNEISLVNDEDLASLGALRDLALDHNKIVKMGRSSFRGLKLNKLFLNNNRLYYLPKGIFDGLAPPDLHAVDISMNNWECICEQEWIGDWLADLGSVNANSGSLGCLVGKCQEAEPADRIYEANDEPQGNEFWIKLAAWILAFVAILLLILAGYFYIQEGQNVLPLRRFSSDTIRLIPSQESLYSIPNPINEVLVAKSPPTIIPPLSIRAPVIKSTNAGMEGDDAKKDRKKVRFNE